MILPVLGHLHVLTVDSKGIGNRIGDISIGLQIYVLSLDSFQLGRGHHAILQSLPGSQCGTAALTACTLNGTNRGLSIVNQTLYTLR